MAEQQGANFCGWTLPETGEALPLATTDFERAAKDLGVEVAAIRAVAEVEASGKTGFDKQGRPKILFEVHRFREATGAKYDATHPQVSAPYTSATRTASYKKDQWKVLKEAFALDPNAAVASASWGLFQVLGSSRIVGGWYSTRSFVDDMFLAEGNHLRLFMGFCKANSLDRHLKSLAWASFARGYNGADYKSNSYDTKLEAAYKKYKGQKK